MSMEILYTPKGKKTSFAIAGGKNPTTFFKEFRFTDEQLDVCIPREDKLQYLNDKKYGNYGSMPLFSSLYSFFSDDKPLILYTAEEGDCDTCLKVFLKYGEGKRPNLDDLLDMRTCMDNYDGDINGAIIKVEKLMEIMFPEKLYLFEHCFGVMGDLGGNFTWDRYQSHNYLPGASPWSHVSMDNEGVKLISLIASQPVEAYSQERVEYYRQQIRNGKRLGCIVYEIEHISNYAIIIDGHHRVIASMLEGVFPDCLKISPAFYRLVIKKEQTILNLQSQNITKKNPGITDLPEKLLEILRNNTIVNKDISEDEKIKYYKFYRSNTKVRGMEFPKEYESATKEVVSKRLGENLAIDE